MARPALCVDTDILIDFLRGRDHAASLFERAVERYRCALPSVAVYEVAFGIERYGRREDRSRLQSILRVVDVLPFDLASARASARLDASLQRSGLRLDFPDLFIAGICLASKLTLLTRNRTHFSRVRTLNLLDPDVLLSGRT